MRVSLHSHATPICFLSLPHLPRESHQQPLFTHKGGVQRSCRVIANASSFTSIIHLAPCSCDTRFNGVYKALDGPVRWQKSANSSPSTRIPGASTAAYESKTAHQSSAGGFANEDALSLSTRPTSATLPAGARVLYATVLAAAGTWSHALSIPSSRSAPFSSPQVQRTKVRAIFVKTVVII